MSQCLKIYKLSGRSGWLVEWGFYALSASKAMFRARTYNCNLFSLVKRRRDLLKLEKVKLDRCYKPKGFGSTYAMELHHFSDASEAGYGQCTYLRQVDEQGRVSCSFVIGKSRVAPTKIVTIPRLELAAAVLSVKMSKFLGAEMDLVNVKEGFWVDSRIVLGYIANEARRFHVFVANRVQAIRDHTEPGQWNHVEGKKNPADDGLAYWGLTPQQQPGSYQGGEMMMESVFWWRKPEYPEETTDHADEASRGTSMDQFLAARSRIS